MRPLLYLIGIILALGVMTTSYYIGYNAMHAGDGAIVGSIVPGLSMSAFHIIVSYISFTVMVLLFSAYIRDLRRQSGTGNGNMTKRTDDTDKAPPHRKDRGHRHDRRVLAT